MGTAFLTYWAKNHAVFMRGRGWPGFRYSDAEQRQLQQLAAPVQRGEFALFLLCNTVLFLALAGAAVALGFWPILRALTPELAQLSFFTFGGLLAATAVLLYAFGLPLSMALAAALLARLYPHPAPALSPAQLQALRRRLRGQLFRISLAAAGIFLGVSALLASLDGQLAQAVMLILRVVAAAFSLVLLTMLLTRLSGR